MKTDATAISLAYLDESTHLIVDEIFELSFLQLVLVSRVFMENLDDGNHAFLQLWYAVLWSLQQTAEFQSSPGVL